MSVHEGLCEFKVHDNNGDTYVTYLSKEVLQKTDGHAINTLRLLNKLKASGQKPVSKWDASLSPDSTVDTSEWLPRPTKVKGQPAAAKERCSQTAPVSGCLPPRAAGKTGADWGRDKPEKTNKFLDVCLPYAEVLRCRAVPQEVWQHISDVLYAEDPYNFNFSADQLREQMRVLKNYRSKKKAGKHGKCTWEFEGRMHLLFESNTGEESSICEPSMSHGLADVYAAGYRSGTLKNANALDKAPVTVADTPHHQLLATSAVSIPVQVDSIPSISGLEVTFLDDLGVAPLTQRDVGATSNPTASFDGHMSFQSAASNLKDVYTIKLVPPRLCSDPAAKDDIEYIDNYTVSSDGHPSSLLSQKNGDSAEQDVYTIKLVPPRLCSDPAAKDDIEYIDNYTVSSDGHPSSLLSQKNGDSAEQDVYTEKSVSPRLGNLDSDVSVPAAGDYIEYTDNDTVSFDPSFLFFEKRGDLNFKDINGNVTKLEPKSPIEYSDGESDIEILELGTSFNQSTELVDTEAARLVPLDLVRDFKRGPRTEVPLGVTAYSTEVDAEVDSDASASATLDTTTQRQSDESTSFHLGFSRRLPSPPPENPCADALHTEAGGVSSENTTLLGQTTFNAQIPMSSTPSGGHAGSTFHLSSPAKKRTSAGFKFRSPTNRTPKRKVAAASLVWDPATTNIFVEECVARKGDVQKDDIPIRVWKEISGAMKEKGETYSWEMCRAKYHQMNNYFANKMIGVGGSLGGIKWPHYERFCEIHDIPIDFVPSDDAAHDIVLTPSKKGQIWVPDAELLLITLYSGMKPKFDGTRSSTRHNTLYNQIGGTMRSFVVKVSGKQCKSHMNSLISEFRKAYDESGQSGAGAPTFLHYDRFLKIFERSATLVTPVAVSVGQGLAYTVAGVIEDDSKRGSRSRPKTTSDNEDKPKRVSKKTLFKSWAQEIQERQLELKEKQNEEFRLMREGFEKRSDERSATLRELVEIVKEKRNNK